jgi:hypothetical protein
MRRTGDDAHRTAAAQAAERTHLGKLLAAVHPAEQQTQVGAGLAQQHALLLGRVLGKRRSEHARVHRQHAAVRAHGGAV